MMSPQNPIPVTILTGFLGAGKTTLLNFVLQSNHGLRVAVLVNDFGSVNIDAQLVVEAREEDTIELSNGCICCTIRGDLIAALVKITQREIPPDHIIIEASGVSDPLEIAMVFRQPALSQLIMVDAVLTVIDAEQILTLERQNETMAVLQVGSADIVVINKVDLVGEDDLQKVRAWVRKIIPNARLLETTFGRVPMELLLGQGTFSYEKLAHRDAIDVHVHAEGEHHDHDHHHHDHSLIFSTWSWQSADLLSLRAVRRLVDSLPKTVYRAKGFLYLLDDPDTMGILQVVGKRASITWGRKWGDATPISQIVVIAEHGGIDPHMFQAQFDATIAKNAPKSDISKLADMALGWLRGKKD
ncbi:MAG: GTP-binding protein [Anaerolineae bacterium]|nr:GTP-binding protein [Anaerolineae bacterium]